MCLRNGLDILPHERNQREDGEQTEDDAWNGGQKLDEEREPPAEPRAGASSARKIAAPTPIGAAIAKARKDVTTVP